jgi:hypothetical protein
MHWIEGWVGPRAVLDAMKTRKHPCFCWESNHDSAVVQPIASPLVLELYLLLLKRKWKSRPFDSAINVHYTLPTSYTYVLENCNITTQMQVLFLASITASNCQVRYSAGSWFVLPVGCPHHCCLIVQSSHNLEGQNGLWGSCDLSVRVCELQSWWICYLGFSLGVIRSYWTSKTPALRNGCCISLNERALNRIGPYTNCSF